jgi:ABC-type glycerol-3-phosphate transport system substrate-binding protein
MAGTTGIAVLAACGGEDKAAAPAAAPAAAKEAAPAAAAPAAAAALEGVEIEVRWNGLDPAGQAAAKDGIVAFKEESGIVIKADFSDWASSFQKITTGFAAGTAPDIWQAGGLWTPVLAAKGGTLFIDEFVNSWSDWSDFYPRGVEDVTYEGHVHGVPYRFNYRGNPVIRPSMFEAAGMDATVPTTWDEANEAAPKLTIRDGDKYTQAGFNLQHSTQVYEDWLYQAGGNYFSEDRTKPLNNTPEGITALKQHVHFGEEGSMPQEGMDSGIPNLHAFCAGKVAFQQLWPGDVANCELNDPEVFADLLVGEPFTGPVEQVMEIYVDKYMNYKLTKSPEGVFATLEWLSRPEVNLKINVESRRSMPCRAAQEIYEIYQVAPWDQYVANAKFGKGRQIVPQHFDVQPAMGRWVEKAALGELTVEEALEGMDKEVLKIITES